MCDKIIILGNSCSGKTKFINKLMGLNVSNYDYRPTIGFNVFRIRVGDSNYDIWDIAGRDELLGIYDDYFLNAKQCLIANIGNVTKWINDCRKYNIPYILFDPKSDLLPVL